MLRNSVRLHRFLHPLSARHYSSILPKSDADDALRKAINVNTQSLSDPTGFWLDQASKLDWFKQPTIACDTSNSPYNTWFPDGETNLSYLSLDVHVANGRGNQDALIHDDFYTGTVRKFTYREMLAQVTQAAAGLSQRGIKRGDHVLIYMPMVPEAVMAMLACARLGAVFTVVFAGFAPHELAKRIADTNPKLIFTSTCVIEPSGPIALLPLVDTALRSLQHAVAEVCVLPRPAAPMQQLSGVRTSTWQDMLVSTGHDAVPLPSAAESFVIHTSGTTGAPKGILRDTGGYATALNYAMRDVYCVPEGGAWLALSDLGWVVGVSFIALGPLIAGRPSVMVEGKPVRGDDAGVFWDALRRHDVQACFVAPTALRAIKRLDPGWDQLGAAVPIKQMFLAGERADTDTLRWARAGLPGVAVKDHYWATEFGWPGLCNVEAVAPEGSAGPPMAGFDFHLLDDDGTAVPAGSPGNLVLKLPMPPGALVTVFNDNERFEQGYLKQFPGFLNTGDGAVADEEGRLYISGRTDDVFNTAGHRLSTSNLEEAAATACDDVAELCVVGVPDVDGIKGEVPAVFLVMKRDKELTPTVYKSVRDAIRREVGPIATPAYIVDVKRLPKTRSGKIVRKLVLQIFNFIVKEKRAGMSLPLAVHITVPATIEDHHVVEELYNGLKQQLKFSFDE